MGKPYTMRELKQIVEYLVEHRHYAEVRGRKMWVDLANTHRIDRTWQSLKETFLKRILPDIHNPYYKLTVEQIASFRREMDITGKHIKKLEIHTITDSSSSNADHVKRNNEQPSTSKAIPENKTSGEDKQCDKISSNRSSADTLVLDTCGGEADGEAQEEEPKSQSKSSRDLITYSEPLTPMLQEILHDFDSDDDPVMQILEDNEIIPERPKSPSPLIIRQSRSLKNDIKKSPAKIIANSKTNERNKSPQSQPKKIMSLKLKKTRKGTWEKGSGDVSDKEQDSNSQTKINSPSKSIDNSEILNTKGSTTEKSKSTINCSNTSMDTPIPNNQEAFSKSKQLANQNNKVAAVNGDLKRSISPPSGPKCKRSKENYIDTSSDVQIVNNSEEVVSIISTPSQHDISKKNEQQKDKSNENSKSINPLTIPEENIETTKQKEAGPSAKIISSNKSEDKNPCLNSVSLFAEQFLTERYSECESDEEAIKSKAKNVEVNLKRHGATVEDKENKIKDMVNNDKTKEIDNSKQKISEKNLTEKNVGEKDIISISDEKPGDVNDVSGGNLAINIVAVSGFINSTDRNLEKPKQTRNISEGLIYQKTQRGKALANVFGFSSGAVRKKTKHRRIVKHHGKRICSKAPLEESSSSDQSTMSESDDSSSPRESSSHQRKYIKPRPNRILSQRDGALFTVEGKHVYPIVRHGKQCMSFAELSETEEEHEVLYWKKRYEEEKLRADELARLLESQKRRPLSPTMNRKPILNSNIGQDQQNGIKENDQPKEFGAKIIDETNKADLRQDNAVKIKFNKENEIEVECQFPHVDPLLEKMAQIFHVNVTQMKKKETEKVIEIESESGRTTPRDPNKDTDRDPEVQEKIKRKESEIFKQIQVLDELEQRKAEPAVNNVTTRRPGRPRKRTDSVPKEADTKKVRAASVSKIQEIKKFKKAAHPQSPSKSDIVSFTSSRKTRASYELEKGAKSVKQSKAANAPVASRPIGMTKVEIPLDDPQVRYKFPKSKEVRSSSRPRTTSKRYAQNVSYAKGDPKMWSSPEICNTNSVESSLGYQDSDASLESAALRRRKRYTLNHFYRKHQARYKLRRRSHPYLADDDTCETIVSTSRSDQNITPNTEVYRSESYQLLGVKNPNDFRSTNQTNTSNKNDVNYKNKSNIQSFTVHDENVLATLQVDRSLSSRTEEGNSSNVSLPLSPELSVVEDLSVSKEILERVEEQPTLNESTGNNDAKSVTNCNKYMMSEIDVSLPLMEQACCELHKENQSLGPENNVISESLLDKICTVDLKEQSSSDTLAVKLRGLLLESAKKIAQKIQGNDVADKDNDMEVDTTVKKGIIVRANKKRCSTPHKRVPKNAKALVEPILEEHSENCSYSGRKSCPPAILLSCDDECIFDENDNNNTVLNAVNTNRRGRKKKDIIKVKITRPQKSKSSLSNKNDKQSISKKETLHSSRKSVCADSGINDESNFLRCCDDDSIELIHNHSDTCLQANESLGDSIEFIQNKTKSIVSVEDSIEENYTEDKELLPELFCNNAHHAGHSNARHEPNEQVSSASAVYFPLSQESGNSLITEDLSDEIDHQTPPPESRPVRPGKWYICSDEETTTFPEEFPAAGSGTGANLKQIFTLVCSVPNLSTISEASRENDSRKGHFTQKTE